ncbi:hypothetical protein [Peribacillus simplex]|uniref:hypothetical protein n=1 Tax=Peribacillus simplex TaxID=1478 RepID=UPI003D28FA6E
MYKVTFTNVDKKVVRALKILKSKNGHTLYNADKLLENIHEIISGETKFNIIVSDVENELDYSFENKIINSNEEIPRLLEILEEDIIASGHDDAQKIINELEKQYQLEAANQNVDEIQDKSRAAKRGNKKGLKFMDRIKGSKNIEKSIDELEKSEVLIGSSVVNDDFAEINDEIIEDSSEPFEDDDIADHTNTNKDLSESFEEINTNRHENIKEENTESPGEFDPNKDMIIDDTYEETYSVHPDELKKAEINDVSHKQNEKVIFPAYDSYLNISQVTPTIERNKERFEKEHLIKFLGLNTFGADKNNSDLHSIMFNYANNMLDDSKFVLLKDYLHNSIETIKDKIQTKLGQAYEQAMALDYEEEATIKLKEDLEKIYVESDSIFEGYQKEQDEEYLVKLAKFEHEQEKALEEFKKGQLLEKSIYIQELDTKKSARISLYKDKVQFDLNTKKEKLLDNKMYELKYMSINQLTETKRQSIRSFEEELDVSVDDSWVSMQNALKELKNDIELKIPFWKQELNEKRKLEAEEREEERKKEELELQKQRIELQRQQLELNKNGGTVKNQSENQDTVFELIEKKFSEFDKRIESKLQNQPQPINNIHPLPESPSHKNSNKRTKTLVTSGALAVLIGGGALLGIGYSSSNDDNTNIAEAKSKNGYEELENKLNDLEGKLTTENIAKVTESPSLESLLNEKKYEEAMRLYKDKDSLTKIEDNLFENKDLPTLIIFNKTFGNETTYGSLDEGILSKETNKVVKIYKGLPNNAKENLSKNRRAAMALLLYQEDEKKLANEILENKK